MDEALGKCLLCGTVTDNVECWDNDTGELRGVCVSCRSDAALGAKDAEIERLKTALIQIANTCENFDLRPGALTAWARHGLGLAALANTAQEPDPETCVWEDRGSDGWWPGCCNEEGGGYSKWEYPSAPETCPNCGKRVEVRG